MGLQNSTRKNLIFVKTKEGKFFAGDDPEPYDELQGQLVDANVEWVKLDKNSENKIKMLTLVVEDDSTRYKLSFNFDNIATTNLVKFLKSADLTQKIAIVPSQKEENGVKKRSIFVKQNEKYMSAFYSKDHPNGLPPLVKTKFKGQEKWDNGAQLEFLEDVIMKEIKPSLVSSPSGSPTPKSEQKKVQSAPEPEYANKLPWEEDEKSGDEPF